MDKRKHSRKRLNAELMVYLKDPSIFMSFGSVFPAQMENISEGGLLFSTSHPDVEVGRPVALQINTSLINSFVVNARIVSVQTLEREDNAHVTHVGVVFDDVEPTVEEHIKNMMAA